MRIVKRAIFLIIYIVSLTNILAADNNCEQVINVKFTPHDGVKVYSVSGGNQDQRGVVDLGHFNVSMSGQKVRVGRVEVDIEMKNGNTGTDTQYDVQLLDPEKLLRTSTNYQYDLTQFVKGSGNQNIKLSFENFRIKINEATIKEKGTGRNIIRFDCNNNKKFGYSFDLVAEIENIGYGGMYGFSPKKNKNGSASYVNIRDIVLDQLNKSK